jgi:glycosyltransferase involved in cell wall biosynthesis
MRWLMLTRKLDPADDRAGFVMRWIVELAARLDHLDVICQESAGPALPPNVNAYSLGKESGVGRIGQARRLVGYLRHLVPQADGVLCHMIARYVLFAAPWTRLYHKPLLHWYTHRQVSLELRIARSLATHILTAAPGSYPLPTGKLAVMGHGIDADLFPLAEGENQPPEILMIGRLSRIKRQDWLLRAALQIAAHADSPPFRVVIIGGATEYEPGYPAELDSLAHDLPVSFTGALPHDRVAEMIQGSAAAVNLSPPGLFDKAALEPMLAGKPVIVTNPDFLPLLGDAADLLYVPFDAGDTVLAERLVHLLRQTPAERAAMGADLRARVLEQHSLAGLMDRLVALMRETAHA